jgi:hypothetical protein
MKRRSAGSGRKAGKAVEKRKTKDFPAFPQQVPLLRRLAVCAFPKPQPRFTH